MPAVGVVPTVGVSPGVAVGVTIGVAVGVGDGCCVGVGTGGVVTAVGLGWTVGEATTVGNVPGPLVVVAVAVKPTDGAAGVGVALLPNGPATRLTRRSTLVWVTTSLATTWCVPEFQPVSLSVTKNEPCSSALIELI